MNSGVGLNIYNTMTHRQNSYKNSLIDKITMNNE